MADLVPYRRAYGYAHYRPPALYAPVLTLTPCDGEIHAACTTVDNATYYYWYLGLSSGNENQVAEKFTSTPSADLSRLTNDTEYFIVVKAFNQGIYSAASNEESATPVALDVPDVTATPGNGEVTLTFATQIGITYNVYMGTSSGGESSVPIATEEGGSDGSASIVIDGLTNDDPYFFVVKAVNQCDQVNPSVEVSATPFGFTSDITWDPAFPGLVWTLSNGNKTASFGAPTVGYQYETGGCVTLFDNPDVPWNQNTFTANFTAGTPTSNQPTRSVITLTVTIVPSTSQVVVVTLDSGLSPSSMTVDYNSPGNNITTVASPGTKTITFHADGSSNITWTVV